MSEPYQTTDKHGSSEPTAEEPRRIFRGGFSLGLTCLAVIGIVVLQATARWTDHQIANLLTAILILVALLSGYVGWLLRQRPGFRVGALPLAIGILAVGLFFVFFRYKGVSGEMVPQFAYRFADPPDYSTTDETSTTIVLNVDPAHDFWQFLGPNRNGFLPDRHFGLELRATPPKRIWSQPLGAGWAGFASAGEYAVTIEQRGHLREDVPREEWVTCYRIDDGSLVWSQRWPAYHYHPLGGAGPRATPTIHGGNVYVQGATGILACLAGDDGSIVWQHDLLQLADWDQSASETMIAWGRSAAPLIHGELVIVPLGGPDDSTRSLIAFDKTTGEERWRAGKSQISYASPVVLTLAGTEQIVVVNEDNVGGYLPESGEELWQHPWPGDSAAAANCSQPVQLSPTDVLVSKGYGGGGMRIRVEATDGNWKTSQVWHQPRVLKTKFTSAVAIDNSLFALSDGSLQCVDAESGEELWRQPRRGRYGQGQLILAEDVIIVQAETGEVALVAANTNQFQELARFPALTGKTWNYPALQGRYLLLRNAEQATCFELPPRQAP